MDKLNEDDNSAGVAYIKNILIHLSVGESVRYLPCLFAGLLIGCGKKREILRHFEGKLCGKKGPLCGKLCDFLKLI